MTSGGIPLGDYPIGMDMGPMAMEWIESLDMISGEYLSKPLLPVLCFFSPGSYSLAKQMQSFSTQDMSQLHFDRAMLTPGNSIEQDSRKNQRYCDCTNYVHRIHKNMPSTRGYPDYYAIFELPCGCRARRGCLQNRFRKPDFNGCCHMCNRRLFKKEWTVDEWMRREYKYGCASVRLNELQKTDRECGICFTPYGKNPNPKKSWKVQISGDSPEFAVRLPCNHILGSRCIKQWLEQKSMGGSQHNNCPMCRRVSTIFEHSSKSYKEALESGHMFSDH